MAIGAVVFWQLVGSGLTFTADDWIILADRSLTLDSLLRPHNEHLSAVPIAIFVVLRDAVGLGPHWLYLLVLDLAHVVAAAGVLVLALRRVRPVVALAGVALLLFLGAASDVMTWMIMVSVVVSTAAGVWALVLLDGPRSRPVLAAALVALGLASSSFGIAIAGAVGVFALLRRDWRAVLALAPVAAGYLAWYGAYHMTGPSVCPPVSAATWATSSVPLSLTTLVYAVGAPLGVGLTTEPLVSMAAAAAGLWVVTLAYAARSRAAVELAAAALAGIVVVGVLIAGSRACLGPQVTGASRYVYTTGYLAMVGLLATPPVGPIGHLVRNRPPLAVGLWSGVALVLSALTLILSFPGLTSTSQISRAVVDVAFSPDGLSCHTQQAQDDPVTFVMEMMPTTARIRDLVEAPGALDPPAWSPVGPVDPALLAQVRHLMCETPPVMSP